MLTSGTVLTVSVVEGSATTVNGTVKLSAAWTGELELNSQDGEVVLPKARGHGYGKLWQYAHPCRRLLIPLIESFTGRRERGFDRSGAPHAFHSGFHVNKNFRNVRGALQDDVFDFVSNCVTLSDSQVPVHDHVQILPAGPLHFRSQKHRDKRASSQGLFGNLLATDFPVCGLLLSFPKCECIIDRASADLAEQHRISRWTNHLRVIFPFPAGTFVD